MRRLALALTGVSAAAIAAAAAVAMAALRDPSPPIAAPGIRHNALHIACPPGSHGKPRYATFGRSLGYGRGQGDVEDMSRRSLTAGRTAPTGAPTGAAAGGIAAAGR